MRSVELFVGAGGLAMGTSAAGFKHDAVVEWNKHACGTIRANQSRQVSPVADWSLFEGDARAFDYSDIGAGIDLVAGGPPCQPFSLGGKHRGQGDTRDMFPEAVRAVRELRPRAFMFENVKGLLRASFAKYFGYIYLQLTFPDLLREAGEEWASHLARLERCKTSNRSSGLHYNVVFRLLNAADYGVPQRRERVFIVGFRSDLGIEWSFPKPTHSRDALLWDQWVTGEYWNRHCVPARHRPKPSAEVMARLSRIGDLVSPSEQPWRTVRDAISDLPTPSPRRDDWPGAINHRLNLGARAYPGHTGSPLDEPAKTLKAGDHGVPGGENMLLTPNGEVRYFTVRESARLQTFPDDYAFVGSWTESMRQLGNAVPVQLGHAVAGNIATKLRAIQSMGGHA